jgi:hypothetical protein
MNTSHCVPDTSRIIQAARSRAQQLREQAIGEFWSGSADGARQALRSAQRLARSLARHARLRERA